MFRCCKGQGSNPNSALDFIRPFSLLLIKFPVHLCIFTRYGLTISFKETKSGAVLSTSGLGKLKKASLFSVADTPIVKVSVFTYLGHDISNNDEKCYTDFH